MTVWFFPCDCRDSRHWFHCFFVPKWTVFRTQNYQHCSNRVYCAYISISFRSSRAPWNNTSVDEMAEATINMGPGTHAIPLSLFRDNRNRVCAELKKNPKVNDSSFVLLQGGDCIPFYDTDTEYVFRQVSGWTLFVVLSDRTINADPCLVLRNRFSFISLAFARRDASVPSMSTAARQHCLCPVCRRNMQPGWDAWFHANNLRSDMASTRFDTLTR